MSNVVELRPDESGDFVFYTEPIDVGRFTVGLGQRNGRGDRIAICSKDSGIADMTIRECRELIRTLTDLVEETA